MDSKKDKGKSIPIYEEIAPAPTKQEILKMLEDLAKRADCPMPKPHFQFLTKEGQDEFDKTMKEYWEENKEIPKQKKKRSGFRGKLMNYEMRKKLFGK